MVKKQKKSQGPVILIPPTAGEESQARSFAVLRMTAICLTVLLVGCSAPADTWIPSIPKDHPANAFYQAAQAGMLSDRVCRDDQGDPSIPLGKIEKGEGYAKLEDVTAGVIRFRDTASGKKYLGVNFLQYSGFLQIPKICAWEEKK